MIPRDLNPPQWMSAPHESIVLPAIAAGLLGRVSAARGTPRQRLSPQSNADCTTPTTEHVARILNYRPPLSGLLCKFDGDPRRAGVASHLGRRKAECRRAIVISGRLDYAKGLHKWHQLLRSLHNFS